MSGGYWHAAKRVSCMPMCWSPVVVRRFTMPAALASLWQRLRGSSFTRKNMTGARSVPRSSSTAPPSSPIARAYAWMRVLLRSPRLRMIVIIVLSLLALLVASLQILYLATGVMCSPDGVVYADRSMEKRFFRVGAIKQSEVRTILLEAIRHVGIIFAKHGVEDWWLDAGMLLGYYRDPSRAWIPWDTDADVSVAVWEVPRLIQIDWVNELDQSEWYARTQEYAVLVEEGGKWDHSDYCWMHLVHRASGLRIEMWVTAMVPQHQMLTAPGAELCTEEWRSGKQDIGRPSDLVFPISKVQIDGIPVQMPRLDTLEQYLEVMLPGCTAGPPQMRQWVCMDSSGASDAFWARQLLPDFLYRFVWERRTAEFRAAGQKGRQADEQFIARFGPATLNAIATATALVRSSGASALEGDPALSPVTVPSSSSPLTLAALSTASAAFQADRGYHWGTCVGMLQLEKASAEGAALVASFLQHERAQRLPWVQELRRQRSEAKNDAAASALPSPRHT